MNKCDECDNMARMSVSGIFPPRVLCAWHCAQLCKDHDDMVGFNKFISLAEGDRVA